MSRLERLQKLAATAPDDPFVHYGVGLELLNLERLDEALAAFERVLALDPRYDGAHLSKAKAELKLGRRDVARATLAAGIAAAQARGDHHGADELAATLETL